MGMGSPVGSAWGANTKCTFHWEGWRGLSAKWTEKQIQEERGVPELLPARAETRLPSGKVTATETVPSCAGTDTLKGLNGRQHQLSSRGERQRSRPAGCKREEGDPQLAPRRVVRVADFAGEKGAGGAAECQYPEAIIASSILMAFLPWMN